LVNDSLINAPHISVLLPARNAAATIGDAIADVLAQRGSPAFELLVIDDASIDSTGAIAAGIARLETRVRVLRGPGEGLVAALQAGLSAARGTLIARMDADDRTGPERFRLQSEWLADHPGAGAVGTQVIMTPRPLSQGLARLEDWLVSLVTESQIRAARFIESPLVHPSLMMRKSALDAVGGYQDNGWAEDWDLLLRLVQAGFSLGAVPRALLEWRDSPERLTRTGAVYRADAMNRLRANYLANGPLRDRPFDIWGAGPTGKLLARALEAHGKTPRRFIDIDAKKQMARGKRVLQAGELGPPDDHLILCAVGAAGARETIRAALEPLGYREEEHYLFTA
jgi:glycosyltransferase involved in cell wall biosynthesis